MSKVFFVWVFIFATTRGGATLCATGLERLTCCFQHTPSLFGSLLGPNRFCSKSLGLKAAKQLIKLDTTQRDSLPDVFDGGSLKWIHLQHEHEQRRHGSVQVLGDVEDASSDLLEQRGDVLVVKGQSATQQGVQDHSAAPDVHLWACVQPKRDRNMNENAFHCVRLQDI